MPDIENVIKGLECCTKKVCIYKDTEKECPYCELCGEYEDAFEDCTTALAKDAIALLKAQDAVEPKLVGVNTWSCGECGALLGWEEFTPSGMELVEDKFCPNCGRAVKWE